MELCPPLACRVSRSEEDVPKWPRGATEAKSVTLVVIGLGYVGLPLLVEASTTEMACVGLDRELRVVEQLAAGRSHVDDVSDQVVARMGESGVAFTTDQQVIAGADVVVICVPTPLNDDQTPDLSAVEAVAAIDRRSVSGLEHSSFSSRPPIPERLTNSSVACSNHRGSSPVRTSISPSHPNESIRETPCTGCATPRRSSAA